MRNINFVRAVLMLQALLMDSAASSNAEEPDWDLRLFKRDPEFMAQVRQAYLQQRTSNSTGAVTTQDIKILAADPAFAFRDLYAFPNPARATKEHPMNISMSTSKFLRNILLCISIVASLGVKSFAFSITFDPNTRNFKISYFSDDLKKDVEVVFEPPTKVIPTVSPQIMFQEAAFIYTYTVFNSTLAAQPIFAFDIQTPSIPDSSSAPRGWFTLSPSTNAPFFGWAASARQGGRDIAAGETLGGFSVRSSLLPGIASLRFEGSVRALAFPDEPPLEVENAIHNIEIKPENNFVELTGITPQFDSKQLIASDLIRRLINLKHESASLGWFFGSNADGIIKSLDAKLEAAKVSINRGQNKTAANQLNAFIRELTTLRGKKLNDNAYFLLKTNAEFIVSKVEP